MNFRSQANVAHAAFRANQSNPSQATSLATRQTIQRAAQVQESVNPTTAAHSNHSPEFWAPPTASTTTPQASSTPSQVPVNQTSVNQTPANSTIGNNQTPESTENSDSIYRIM